MKRPVRARRRFLVLATSWAFFAAAAAWGQSPCELSLNEAGKVYEAGEFEQVPPLLEVCLRETRRERSRALALLAKAYVMADQIEKARPAVEELLRVDPAYEPDTLGDPSRFVRLVEQVKRESFTLQVSSVSKSAESLREAPATVVVVTAEEIKRRGYLDLEQVLHDLPGFDISRGVGLIYSNVYQRGLRSDLISRTLLLVDGVEENELWSQSAVIGRHYPLNNIERVEVIYGPASTMYGPGSFAGVVNVITKEPESFIQEDQSLGAHVVATSGSFDTNYVDATVAGRTKSGTLRWSLTSRFFRSDEHDLSGFDDWDYDPAYFEGVDYGSLLNIEGAQGASDFRSFLDSQGIDDCTGQPGCYFTLGAGSVELTPAGLARAVELDQAAYANGPLGGPVSFSNPTKDQYVTAKLGISNFLFGISRWSYVEGSGGWWTDRFVPGSNDGIKWNVEFTNIYTKYSRSVGRDLSINFFSRYKQHELADETVLSFLTSYATRSFGYNLQSLVQGLPAGWFTQYHSLLHSQVRVELTTVYNPSEKLNVVGGFEFRNSSIQSNYLSSFDPHPEDHGAPVVNPPGGNRFRIEDMGIFAQASYKPRKDLKLVLGGRFDHNKVRSNLGYGTVFVPRLGVVYMPGNFVFKAIYSEAFQPPSTLQQYTITPGLTDLPSDNLQPDEIKNFELSMGWQRGESFSLELAAYEAKASDVVQAVTVPCESREGYLCTASTTLGYRGIGALRIRGAQAVASWRHKGYTITGNLTYTDPVNTDPRDPRDPNLGPLLDEAGQPIKNLRVGDFADHQANLQFATTFFGKLLFNAQASYVGSKRTGKGTTVLDNPYTLIGSYFTTNATLTYKHERSGLSFQLIGNNVFDESYYHPGVREANGFNVAARIPQPGRTIYLRILFDY